MLHKLPRRAVTLTEVLIAMFVMAIGMLGLLALFPLGAMHMAQAVKDERTAQLADICEGHARILWRNAYLNTNGSLNPDATVYASAAELAAMDNPNAGFPAGAAHPFPNPPLAPVPPSSSAPSYPVYIDPLGFSNRGATDPSRWWVGGESAGFPRVLPRRSVQATLNANPAVQRRAQIKLCTLLDDMSYTNQGLAADASQPQVNRGSKYTAAFLLQRPKNNVRHEVNLTIVTYQNRPLADSTLPEIGMSAFSNVFPGSTSVSFSRAGLGTVAPVKKGGWILLTGVASNTTGSNQNYADFYRVTGIADGVNNTWALEVTPPIRQRTAGAFYFTSVCILDGVVEVFDRGTLTPYEAPN